jgi:hypothetical protein
MFIKPSRWPIFITNVLGLATFTVLFVSRQNYQFLIVGTNRKVAYPDSLLWGLMAWAYLNMSGGGLHIGGRKLYELILVHISESYGIFRYDQFVHTVGFGGLTLLMCYLLTRILPSRPKQWTAVSMLVVMAGLGVGALNEIVDFMATVVMPETGVGGYQHSALTL